MTITKARRSQGGMFGSGREIHPLNQVSIQPAGVPSTPFVQAPRYETGGNLTRLAQSLSNLNNSLNNLANVNSQIQADPNSHENRQWMAQRQQMSEEELLNEVQSNTPQGNRAREDYLYLLVANKMAAKAKTSITEKYATSFDKTTGDFESFWNEELGQYTSLLGDIDLAKAIFIKQMDGFKTQLQESDQLAKVSYTVQEIQGSFRDTIRNTLDDAVNVQNLTPEEAVKAAFGNAKTLSDFVSLSPAETVSNLMNLVNEYADQGNIAMVEALLKTDRGGMGKSLHFLKGSEATQLINKAYEVNRKGNTEKDLNTRLELDQLVLNGELTKEEADKYYKSGLLTFSEAHAAVNASNEVNARNAAAFEEARQANINLDNHLQYKNQINAQNLSLLAHHGSLSQLRDVEIPNEKGTGWQKITAAEQRQAVLDLKNRQWEQDFQSLIDSGVDEEEARNTINTLKLDFYSAQNLVNEEWQNQFLSLPLFATVERLTQDEGTAKQASATANLYLNMKAQNPVYLAKLIGGDKQAQTFFDALYVNYEFQSGNLDHALRAAAHEVATPNLDKALRRLDPQVMENVVTQVMDGLEGVDASALSNIEAVRTRIHNLVEAGVHSEKITAAVLREVKNSYLVYNGMLVRNSGKLPSHFMGLMDTTVKEKYNELVESGLELAEDDLFIVPDSTQTLWEIHSKSYTGKPLGVITMQDLEQTRQSIQEDQDNLTRALLSKSGLKASEKVEKHQDKIQKYLKKLQLPSGAASLKRQFKSIKAKISQLEGLVEYWDHQKVPAMRNAMTEQLKQSRLELIQLEGQELLSQGIYPNSPEWIKWKVAHGLDVTPLESIFFGEFALPDNKQFQPVKD